MIAFKKKLALVFTGAVSLGSFEAGVASELVRAMKEDSECEYDVDLIVGASAGALTGVLTALILAYGLDEQMLKEAWMSLDLDELLKLNEADRSILSSSKVQQKIKHFIKPPPGNKALKEIKVAVVVTNLDGFLYTLNTENQFIKAVSYEDFFQFNIGPKFNDWHRLRQSIQASSAYPVAFEHVSLERKEDDKMRYNIKYLSDGKKLSKYSYTDGGLVNNQPLNLAMEQVNYLISEVNNQKLSQDEERIFLVIDPTPPVLQKSVEDYGVLDVLAKSLWTIPHSQTLYRDIFQVEKINQQICFKNNLMKLVLEMTKHLADDYPNEKLKKFSGEIAAYKASQIHNVSPQIYLESEMQRIKRIYQSELAQVKDIEKASLLYFIVENIMNVRDKNPIRVEMISPECPQEELSGVALGNFGGLIDHNLMIHDYEVGRNYGRRWLNKEDEQLNVQNVIAMNVPAETQERIVKKMIDNFLPILMNELEKKGPVFGQEDANISAFKYLRFIAGSSLKYFWWKSISSVKEKNISRVTKKKLNKIK